MPFRYPSTRILVIFKICAPPSDIAIMTWRDCARVYGSVHLGNDCVCTSHLPLVVLAHRCHKLTAISAYDRIGMNEQEKAYLPGAFTDCIRTAQFSAIVPFFDQMAGTDVPYCLCL